MHLLDRIPVALPAMSVPNKLQGIERLAANLWWRRDREARALFRSLDPEIWDGGATPMQMLLRHGSLEDVAVDVASLQRVLERFDAYLAESKSRLWPQFEKGPIAYFCAEFGLQSRIRLYCGGLGILAGDHCMEASDLGLPFIAVGLLYRRGFFRQLIDRDGRQQHVDPVVDPVASSIFPVLAEDKPLAVEVPLPGRTVHAQVWLATIGTVPVLLLDTDHPSNSPIDRLVTSQLYTVGREMRICQEAVLGVGGVRALHALGIQPSVFHLNEGHSALLLLERLSKSVRTGQSAEVAMERIKASSVLTIHTPVPEGNERFDAGQMKQVVSEVVKGTALAPEEIMRLGLDSKSDPEVFDMTAFALRLTHAANGVSLLHGHTADRTWRKTAGRPVTGVTNGVHMPTWIGPEMTALFSKAGAKLTGLTEVPTEPGKNERGRWFAIQNVDDGELWQAHKAQKQRFIEFAHRRLLEQHARYGEDPSNLKGLESVLNSDALIIGFSRRFATYKRGTLVFTDPRRAQKLLGSKTRPVNIVFSGKAYPTDQAGQAMLARIYRMSQSPRFWGKVFVLEDYDMEIAEALVQGVDLWLNNPRRPMEASGTSGMKAAANGAPNASILDGWWDEAYQAGHGRNGFAIGLHKATADPADQDKYDAEDLYRVLEQEVVPTFYKRGADSLPRDWIRMMKNSIADSLSAFSTRRMIEDYVKMYGSAVL